MEKIGLFFRVPNTYGKVLSDLLGSLLEEDKYIWRKGNHIEILFSDDFNSEMKNIERLKTLNNDQMKRYVSFGSYYPIIATFSGYLTNGEIGSSILNGKEFLNSPCNVLISIVDTTEVTFLSKDNDVITDMEKKYFQYNFSDLRYMDVEDCVKLRFD
ncbi:DUF2691 family protein [Ornithinibacillus massiliensis]|uniref:DUF2691 family protein n=1 Tax=Ornithinibacillus massiliensis TaxID=1944633 RepID=A0ABS5MH33_9BACI|nr:DUF2691 family protein [Ornithinibacillus massiliensis]MBS3681654.1 DUF2691 family protein [Ornithinibacillus massiliensis]